MLVHLIDIDSLHPDRMGCYGYHRNTSPAIDTFAADSIRLGNCFASDVPRIIREFPTWYRMLKWNSIGPISTKIWKQS
jgi:hypothetical protein